MSRYDKYSENALNILLKAQDISQKSYVEASCKELAEALLLSDLPDIVAIARRNNADVDTNKVKSLNNRVETVVPVNDNDVVKISDEFRTVLDKAEALAGDSQVEPAHLIKAGWPGIRTELAKFLRPTVAPDLTLQPDDISLPDITPQTKPNEAISILLSFGEELTAINADFPIFGRDTEIASLVSILTKFWKPNPLIIGESGVGKTALVQGLAMRIKSGNVPSRLKNARIFNIRVPDLIAGANMRGASEENVIQVIEAAEALDNVYLFIDEIHQIVPAFANNPISEVFKPALSSGRIRCIGATTTSDYAHYLEKESALLRRFQTILVKEPDEASLKNIVLSLAPKLEKHFGVNISSEICSRAIEISKRYLPMKKFPDKALDVLDRAASKALCSDMQSVSESNLYEAVKDIANVVVDKDIDESNAIFGLEAAISKNLIGQDDAIKTMANAIRIAKLRIDPHKNRPAGSFMLTGPTGVGKTAFAENLAKVISGRDDALFRIDMSEFSESHTSARLLGAPPGYIGYDDKSLLSRAVDTCAGGVLLLDEFEKAHPQVHRIFLQILDAGRVTDSTGRVLSFSSLTIVATCNVGKTDTMPLGFMSDAAETIISESEKIPMAALRKAFPIELLNRFDAIVPFRALNINDAKNILSNIIIRVSNENLLTEYGITLSLSQAAIDKVVADGFSLDFGVRNLYRAFKKLILQNMAENITNLIGQGSFYVDYVDKQITFTKI